MVEYKVLTTILPSGTNTATFTDALIGSETKIDVYTTDDDTIIENQEQSGTTVTITVSNHTDSLGIALVINNVEEFEPYNDDAIIQSINVLTNRVLNNEVDIESINQDISTLDGMVTDLGTEVDNLETSKQDTLIPGDNISIVNNVISASGGGSQGEIYDGTERVIGTWFGKPLYRQCFTYSGDSISVPTNTWVNTWVNKSNINIKNGWIVLSTSLYPLIFDAVSTTPIRIMQTRNATPTIDSGSVLVIEYTKVGE